MPQVFIACPKTGEAVYTGLNFDWFALDSMTPAEQSVTCSACGESHVWTKREAFLRADGGGD